ncbi:unnamed protein product [Prorocentrum cordatum]|uniref:Uncharacterized protein n=1 Tax=Prorocentrum cordatum TaxID=2364126 RepID=A0ABN9QMI0_9DINO|nr:unnamed protein product [Polarella glacialis]
MGTLRPADRQTRRSGRRTPGRSTFPSSGSGTRRSASRSPGRTESRDDPSISLQLEGITGSFASTHQMMMQNTQDIIDLRPRVQGSLNRRSQLSDQLVLCGQDVRRKHDEWQNPLTSALKSQGDKIEQMGLSLAGPPLGTATDQPIPGAKRGELESQVDELQEARRVTGAKSCEIHPPPDARFLAALTAEARRWRSGI